MKVSMNMEQGAREGGVLEGGWGVAMAGLILNKEGGLVQMKGGAKALGPWGGVEGRHWAEGRYPIASGGKPDLL